MVTRDDIEYPGTRQLLRWIFGRTERYRVVGESMMPTLLDGEFVLVASTPDVREDQIVLARHPDDAELVMLKRVTRIVDDRYFLMSDNPAGTDSRRFGPVPRSAIMGVVEARFPTSR